MNKQATHPYILQQGEHLHIDITKTSNNQVIFTMTDKEGVLVANVVPVKDFITGLEKMLKTPTSKKVI